MEEILLGLLAIAWAIGTPVIAIVALVRTARLREANERLTAEVALLRRQGLPAEGLPPPFVAEPVARPVVESPPLLDPVSAPVADASAQPPEPVLPPPLAIEPVQGGWEQRLGARAFLWVGAVTLALAAIFLVRYSIEEGYLSPEVRVILAALFGFALIGGAEKTRSRDERVAQALAAAGVAALYGALFSAVALYGMISKVAAGGGAAALTAFAIGVSLRHGILVAALAFVGGFASPAIIGSETPNTPVLFGYLLAIAAGTLGVIRIRGWWPLGCGPAAERTGAMSSPSGRRWPLAGCYRSSGARRYSIGTGGCSASDLDSVGIDALHRCFYTTCTQRGCPYEALLPASQPQPRPGHRGAGRGHADHAAHNPERAAVHGAGAAEAFRNQPGDSHHHLDWWADRAGGRHHRPGAPADRVRERLARRAD